MFKKSTKFLIVDDMNMFRAMVKQSLTAMEFTKHFEANDGSVALKMLEEAVQSNEPFEFVICDWNMPKMKGIELLRKVRASSWGKTLPFLMLTAEAEKTTVVEALKEGVDGYIIKPFTVNSLSANLKAIHDKKNVSKAS
ncbi:MAG: response regulator [Proteobacteria bacterium]|nr:MAG: response regulator [Pseudomonadota bacterium]